MASEKNSFAHKFYKVIMPKVYGIGAAIVIAGAMFKLLNWPGGGLMLGLGLTTEALIFFLSSFEPPAKEVDWTKVYPELDEHYSGMPSVARQQAQPIEGLSEKLDEMLAKAKVDGALLDRLGQGMQYLADSVNHIAALANTVPLTEQYATNLQKASENLENLYKSQTSLLSSMQKLDHLTQYMHDFSEGLQSITHTLTRANNMYTTELQELNQQIGNTKTIYAGLSESIEQLQSASSETENFRLELAKLNEKLSSLNHVYGNMLMALKS